MKDSIEAKSNQYQSYLLRMWKNEDGNWRALLVTIPSQERRHFASLQELFNFLNEQQINPAILDVSLPSHNHTSLHLSAPLMP